MSPLKETYCVDMILYHRPIEALIHLSHRSSSFALICHRHPHPPHTHAHTALLAHTQGQPLCVLSYWMQDHEVIDEVLLNELGDRQNMTFYTLPPLPQTPTSPLMTVRPRPFFRLSKMHIWSHTLGRQTINVTKREKFPGWNLRSTLQYSNRQIPTDVSFVWFAQDSLMCWSENGKASVWLVVCVCGNNNQSVVKCIILTSEPYRFKSVKPPKLRLGPCLNSSSVIGLFLIENLPSIRVYFIVFFRQMSCVTSIKTLH